MQQSLLFVVSKPDPHNELGKLAAVITPILQNTLTFREVREIAQSCELASKWRGGLFSGYFSVNLALDSWVGSKENFE